jgi:hypothetical protein
VKKEEIVNNCIVCTDMHGYCEFCPNTALPMTHRDPGDENDSYQMRYSYLTVTYRFLSPTRRDDALKTIRYDAQSRDYQIVNTLKDAA